MYVSVDSLTVGGTVTFPSTTRTKTRRASFWWNNPFSCLVFVGIDWQVKPSAGSRDFNRSLCNLLLLRGAELGTADPAPFSDPVLYPTWVPPVAGAALQTWVHPRPFNGYEKSAVLVSNGQSQVEAMDSMVERAWSMFAHRAFVHHYQKHGMDEEDFVDSFACLEQVISSYKRL